jgi:hypothetical protein
MDKIWYIKILGNREGPYSIMDLRRDRRITPDTLVWRQGFDRWQRIRYVPELQAVFDDPVPENGTEEKMKFSKIPDDDEIVLDFQGKDPHRWLWFLLIGILLFYIWVSLWF